MINRRVLLLLLAAVVGSTTAISPITSNVAAPKRSSPPTSPWGVEKVARGGGGDVGSRFSSTLDVIVSKLFPAGFCWQLASMMTKSDASSAKFAITTGAGEAAGVLGGHVLYSLIKGGYDKSVLESALLLATGTLCSGTSWQPVVNALQSMDLPFYAGKSQTMLATYFVNILLSTECHSTAFQSLLTNLINTICDYGYSVCWNLDLLHICIQLRTSYRS